MRNLKEFEHYLNHNIIKDPNVPDSPLSMDLLVCLTCGILLCLNEDGILLDDYFLEKLNITCEEYQIKKLLE